MSLEAAKLKGQVISPAVIAFLIFMWIIYTGVFSALVWVYWELWKWHKDLKMRKDNRKDKS